MMEAAVLFRVILGQNVVIFKSGTDTKILICVFCGYIISLDSPLGNPRGFKKGGHHDAG